MDGHRRRTRGCSRCTCTPTFTQSPKIYSMGWKFPEIPRPRPVLVHLHYLEHFGASVHTYSKYTKLHSRTKRYAPHLVGGRRMEEMVGYFKNKLKNEKDIKFLNFSKTMFIMFLIYFQSMKYCHFKRSHKISTKDLCIVTPLYCVAISL